jgi:lipopolysaccharide/colanic/teichoic acid biosynthesis glycosyltransferase
MYKNEAKEYAKNRLGAWGWEGQFDSLDKLWTKESDWNYKAKNKSGASGIPQLKGGSNVPNFDTDYKIQVEHGLSYIKNRSCLRRKSWPIGTTESTNCTARQ